MNDDFFYKNVVKAIIIILNITQNCDKCFFHQTFIAVKKEKYYTKWLRFLLD
jgi:hypothetical protein